MVLRGSGKLRLLARDTAANHWEEQHPAATAVSTQRAAEATMAANSRAVVQATTTTACAERNTEVQLSKRSAAVTNSQKLSSVYALLEDLRQTLQHAAAQRREMELVLQHRQQQLESSQQQLLHSQQQLQECQQQLQLEKQKRAYSEEEYRVLCMQLQQVVDTFAVEHTQPPQRAERQQQQQQRTQRVMGALALERSSEQVADHDSNSSPRSSGSKMAVLRGFAQLLRVTLARNLCAQMEVDGGLGAPAGETVRNTNTGAVAAVATGEEGVSFFRLLSERDSVGQSGAQRSQTEATRNKSCLVSKRDLHCAADVLAASTAERFASERNSLGAASAAAAAGFFSCTPETDGAAASRFQSETATAANANAVNASVAVVGSARSAHTSHSVAVAGSGRRHSTYDPTTGTAAAVSLDSQDSSGAVDYATAIADNNSLSMPCFLVTTAAAAAATSQHKTQEQQCSSQQQQKRELQKSRVSELSAQPSLRKVDSKEDSEEQQPQQPTLHSSIRTPICAAASSPSSVRCSAQPDSTAADALAAVATANAAAACCEDAPVVATNAATANAEKELLQSEEASFLRNSAAMRRLPKAKVAETLVTSSSSGETLLRNSAEEAKQSARDDTEEFEETSETEQQTSLNEKTATPTADAADAAAKPRNPVGQLTRQHLQRHNKRFVKHSQDWANSPEDQSVSELSDRSDLSSNTSSVSSQYAAGPAALHVNPAAPASVGAPAPAAAPAFSAGYTRGKPAFIPSLMTEKAGTGSWLTGRREPSEYPQGI